MDQIIQTLLGFVITPSQLLMGGIIEITLTLLAVSNFYLCKRKLAKDRRNGHFEFTKLSWWIELFKNIYKRIITRKSSGFIEAYSADVIPRAQETRIDFDEGGMRAQKRKLN